MEKGKEQAERLGCHPEIKGIFSRVGVRCCGEVKIENKFKGSLLCVRK